MGHTAVSDIDSSSVTIYKWRKEPEECTVLLQMSRVVRKSAFYICKNKDADQLRGYREADQRLCFRYTDSTS